MIGKWNEKDGGWDKWQNTIGPKNYGFDSNGVLELIKEKKKMGVETNSRLKLSYKNLERIGVHDRMVDCLPNQLLANATAH